MLILPLYKKEVRIYIWNFAFQCRICAFESQIFAFKSRDCISISLEFYFQFWLLKVKWLEISHFKLELSRLYLKILGLNLEITLQHIIKNIIRLNRNYLIRIFGFTTCNFVFFLFHEILNLKVRISSFHYRMLL